MMCDAKSNEIEKPVPRCWIESSSTATIWQHFFKLKSSTEQLAKCKTCNKILKTSGGCTKGLHNHRKQHSHSGSTTSINVDLDAEQKSTTCNSEPPCKKVKQITSFFTQNQSARDYKITHLVAIDGLPMRVLTSSFDLRQMIAHMPSSPNSISSIIKSVADDVRKLITTDLNRLKLNGERFSLTVDEWTSIGTRRYLNINIHTCEEVFNTGLVRIFGPCDATVCLNMIKSHLSSFEISLESDIVAIVSDGANVMVRVCINSECVRQTCIAHAIHLAVVSTFYASKLEEHSSETNDSIDDASDSLSDAEDNGD